jgi:hypothetical protein
MAERVIGEVRSYDQFTQILRDWVGGELNTSYESVNEIAGLPGNYLSKLISRTPVRSFSRMSLGATLGALCLKLLVAVDTEKLEAMRPRYTLRKKHACNSMLANGHLAKMRKSRAKPRKMGNPQLQNAAVAAFYGHRRAAILSPQRRRQIAKAAALARWRNGRHEGEAAPVR